MRKNISFAVDSDVYEKFNMALNLSGDTSEEAVDVSVGISHKHLAMHRKNIHQEL